MEDVESEVSKIVHMRDSLESVPIKPAEDTKQKKSKHRQSTKARQKEIAAQRELLLSGRNALFVQSYLAKKTHFNKEEIRVLQLMYKCFKGDNNKNTKIDRLRFRDMVASLFGITNNVMLDRIFQAFDGDNEGSVSEVEWIIGLSALLRGSLDQQIAYTYDVYDINGDRSIGREEVLNCLRGSLHVVHGVLDHDEVDDGIKELVDIVIRKMDINRDSNIIFSEYRHILRNDPLLLEALGECLPDERAALPFVALLSPNPRDYKSYISRPGDSSWSKEKDRYSEYRGENLHHEGYEQEADAGRTLTIPGKALNTTDPRTTTVTPGPLSTYSSLMPSSVAVNKKRRTKPAAGIGRIKHVESRGVPLRMQMAPHQRAKIELVGTLNDRNRVELYTSRQALSEHQPRVMPRRAKKPDKIASTMRKVFAQSKSKSKTRQ